MNYTKEQISEIISKLAVQRNALDELSIVGVECNALVIRVLLIVFPLDFLGKDFW